MKKFNGLCAVIVVITIALFVVTLGQNIVARTASIYLYHFNDRNCVGLITTELTGEEVANKITDYMNSWDEGEFQIKEFTGYDYQGIFTDDESYNMFIAHKLLKKSAVICIVSFVISFSIMLYFILKRKRLLVRVTMAVSGVLTIVSMAAQSALLTSSSGRQWIRDRYGLFDLNKECNLVTILGGDYFDTATRFFLLFSAVALGVIFYLCYRLTRPDRLFS